MKLGRFEIKRRENTVWDYVVPLSLVLLGDVYLLYYSWNCYFADTGGRWITQSGLNKTILAGLIVLLVFIFATIFLTRAQRVIAFPWLLIPTWIFVKYYGLFAFIHFTQSNIAISGAIGFFFGNLALIIKYGNNSMEKAKKYGLKRSLIAWGIFGFSLFGAVDPGGCSLPVAPGVIGIPISRFDIFNRIYEYLESSVFGGSEKLTIVALFLSFALIGFVVEKLNQRRAAK